MWGTVTLGCFIQSIHSRWWRGGRPCFFYPFTDPPPFNQPKIRTRLSPTQFRKVMGRGKWVEAPAGCVFPLAYMCISMSFCICVSLLYIYIMSHNTRAASNSIIQSNQSNRHTHPHRTVLAVEGEPLARLLLISHGRVQASVNQVGTRLHVFVFVLYKTHAR